MGNRTTLRDHLSWHDRYVASWDDSPACYREAGVVPAGKLRRLARWDSTDQIGRAYLGVQAHDPARWGMAGEARTVFFVSLFLAGRTLAVRTFPTMADALVYLATFVDRLENRG